jgi:hypothetical protein
MALLSAIVLNPSISNCVFSAIIVFTAQTNRTTVAIWNADPCTMFYNGLALHFTAQFYAVCTRTRLTRRIVAIPLFSIVIINPIYKAVALFKLWFAVKFVTATAWHAITPHIYNDYFVFGTSNRIANRSFASTAKKLVSKEFSRHKTHSGIIRQHSSSGI